MTDEAQTDEAQTEKQGHKLHLPTLNVMLELHTTTVLWSSLDGQPFEIVNRLLDKALAEHLPDDRVVLTPLGITEALSAYALRQKRHDENHADAMRALTSPMAATKTATGQSVQQLDDRALAALVPAFTAGVDIGAVGPQVQAYCDQMEKTHADTVAMLPEWLRAPVKAQLWTGMAPADVSGALDDAAAKIHESTKP